VDDAAPGMVAVRDGLELRRRYEGEDIWLEVVRAEPRALFSAEILESLRYGGGMPEVSVDRPVAVGAVVRIRARNRHVVYRLTEHDFALDLYTGVWPD
jgi:hypothetical protein